MIDNIPGQMTIWDFPQALPEPFVGEFGKTHGQIICHVMRKGYTGKKVLIEVAAGTFQCGILEEYAEMPNGLMRSTVRVGNGLKYRITHRPGVEIFEPLPWDAYPERMRAIGRRE